MPHPGRPGRTAFPEPALEEPTGAWAARGATAWQEGTGGWAREGVAAGDERTGAWAPRSAGSAAIALVPPEPEPEPEPVDWPAPAPVPPVPREPARVEYGAVDLAEPTGAGAIGLDTGAFAPEAGSGLTGALCLDTPTFATRIDGGDGSFAEAADGPAPREARPPPIPAPDPASARPAAAPLAAERGPEAVSGRGAPVAASASFEIAPVEAQTHGTGVDGAGSPSGDAALLAAAERARAALRARAPAATTAAPASDGAPQERRAFRAALQAGRDWLWPAVLVAAACALFVGWRGLGPGGGAVLRVAQLRGGLYDTEAGAPALVVRGEVVARAAVPGPVRVRVDVVRGGEVVATADALAGAAATPEEVHAVSGPERAAALRTALEGRAAHALARGAHAPFVVVFPPPAPEPGALELRATAEAIPIADGAARAER